MNLEDQPTPEEQAAADADLPGVVRRGRFLRRRRLSGIATGIALPCAAAAAVIVASTGGDHARQVVTVTGPSSTLGISSPKGPPTTSGGPFCKLPYFTYADENSHGQSQFAFSITTNKSTYREGEPVNITVTATNLGPTCHEAQGLLMACSAVTASKSGQEAWNSQAQPTIAEGGIRFCGDAVPPTTFPRGQTTSYRLTWDQTRCISDPYAGQLLPPGDPNNAPLGSPNPDCPDTQLPAGQYSLSWAGDPTIAPPPITITPGTNTPTTATSSSVPSGYFVDGSQSIPHYVMSVTNTASGLSGWMFFVYQDGRISETFHYHSTGGSSENLPNVSLVTDSTSQTFPYGSPPPGTQAGSQPVPPGRTFSVTYRNTNVGATLTLSDCGAYLYWANPSNTTTPMPCTFSYSGTNTW